MISECKNRLCGITTAPKTLITTGSEPFGTSGFAHPINACFHSISEIQISNKNENPIRDTNKMINFSILL